jgi:hypothetical protein
MRTRRTISGISVLVLAFSLAAGLGAPAPTLGASDLRICGRVNALVEPSVLLPGALTVGSTTLVIAAGTDLPSQVEVGANLCFNLHLDSDGTVTGTTVSANPTSSAEICGVVSSFARATAASTGTLDINGVDFVLATGSHLPASVVSGADLCLDLTLNGFGQVSGGTARANAHSTVQVCGKVTNDDAATASSTGALTIGPRSFVTGVGSALPAAVREGANLCAALTLNALAQVAGGSVQANVGSTVEVCGQVDAAAAATPTSDGSLVIDSVPRSVAAGTSLSPAVRAGAFVRLRLMLDAFGRVADDAVLASGASLGAVCGRSGSTAPSPSPAQPGASASPEPSGGGGAAAGAGESPAASDHPSGNQGQGAGQGSGQGSGQSTCSSSGAGDPQGAPAAGNGGPIPDTASLGRAGRVIGLMAVPLLALIVLVVGYLAVHGRLGPTPEGMPEDRAAGEVAS